MADPQAPQNPQTPAQPAQPAANPSQNQWEVASEAPAAPQTPAVPSTPGTMSKIALGALAGAQSPSNDNPWEVTSESPIAPPAPKPDIVDRLAAKVPLADRINKGLKEGVEAGFGLHDIDASNHPMVQALGQTWDNLKAAARQSYARLGGDLPIPGVGGDAVKTLAAAATPIDMLAEGINGMANLIEGGGKELIAGAKSKDPQQISRGFGKMMSGMSQAIAGSELPDVSDNAMSVAKAGASKISDALENSRAAKVAAKTAEADKAAEAGEVTEGHFKKAAEPPQPQHGKPVEVASPLDRATINNMPGGKDLSPEAVDTLHQHVGDTIPVGSTAKNTVMRAVEPVQKALTDTGIKMNKVIANAPEFSTSTLGDTESTLLKDVADIRENLPTKEDDPLNKVVDKQVEAAYPALNSTNPAEVLAYRRKLGTQIDWNNIVRNPETSGEAANLTKVKIYNSLGNKIHTEIPETVELDKIFQPNLELQSHLDAKLGKAVSRDPVEANAQAASEFRKGKVALNVAKHNAQVDKNIGIAKKVLTALGAGAAGGIGIDMAKHLIP